MSVIHDILASAPGVSEWSFVALCLLSFLTSAVSAAVGLGGGAALTLVLHNDLIVVVKAALNGRGHLLVVGVISQ